MTEDRFTEEGSVIPWRGVSIALTRFLLRCTADYAEAVGSDGQTFPSGVVRFKQSPTQWDEPLAAVWVEGDAGNLYDDGEDPDTYGGQLFTTYAVEDAMNTTTGDVNTGKEDVWLYGEAMSFIHRVADRLLLLAETRLRGKNYYRAWQGFQRFNRSVARNRLAALADVNQFVLSSPREPQPRRRISSRLKPGHKRKSVPLLGVPDIQIRKASMVDAWGGGERWKRLGKSAWHWPRGRPPLPASEWLKRYKARRKAQRKAPNRKYSMRNRKKLTVAAWVKVLRPRPSTREARTRANLHA